MNVSLFTSTNEATQVGLKFPTDESHHWIEIYQRGSRIDIHLGDAQRFADFECQMRAALDQAHAHYFPDPAETEECDRENRRELQLEPEPPFAAEHYQAVLS